MTTIGLAIERALFPLDVLRALLLRAFGRAGQRLLADREARVGLVGAVSVLTALTMTLAVPVWMLALSPLLLGVPHLLADARYLVARPKLARNLRVAIAVGVPLVATWMHPRLWIGSLAIVGAGLVARGSLTRRAVVLAGGVALTLCAVYFERVTTVVFAHAHNLIALALFAAWTRRENRFHRPTIVLALVGVALLLFMPSKAVATLSSHSVFGVDLAYFGHAVSLSGSAETTARLALVFAFGQAVHYGVWLRLVPEEDRERSGIRSFASSFRALVRDVGLPVVLLFGAASLFFVAYGVHDLFAARDAYLRVSIFHGPFELAMVSLFFVAKRPLRSAPPE